MGLVFKTIEFLKKFGILCLEFFNGTFKILHLVYVFLFEGVEVSG